ncbi:MAG: peptidoglycan-binding protein, partial [Ignavibacteriales bacterium]|nr:peptidoglycan-binding protein [Ignavibacteriales bacterium]
MQELLVRRGNRQSAVENEFILHLQPNRIMRITLYIILFAFSTIIPQTWQSTKVFYQNDRLVYASDIENNKLPDFSYAGYKRSEDSIPTVPVVKTISPVSGDNTTHIQAALDEVGRMPLNANGIRGALLLQAGNYNVFGTVFLKYSGVVLRGVGDSENSLTSTILIGKGDDPHQRTILVVGGGSNTMWKDSVSGTKTYITSDTIVVGDRTFTVANSAPYKVGDNIIIYHPCSDAWLQSVDYGGTNGTEFWTVGEHPIVYNRRIIEKTGNTLTIDAPVFNHLLRQLSQSYIYKYSRQGIVTNAGVENLRIDIETAGGVDENHAWDAVDMAQIEDSWIRNCTFLHFGMSGVQTYTASRITIENCIAKDPISIIEGGKRYNFNCYAASQLVLFKNCTAINGRHHYVSNGHSLTSGIVFYKCRSEKTNSSNEGHRRWTQGMLYDNLVDTLPNVSNHILGLYNRGDYGTGHGWASVHSVAWNCKAGQRDIIIQKPPTGQNYAIGCSARVISGNKPPAPYDQPQGYIEGKDKAGLVPASLFEAQLAERLNPSSVENRKGVIPSEGSLLLFDAFPNPFNPTVKMQITLRKRATLRLEAFDTLGRLVSVISESTLQAG